MVIDKIVLNNGPVIKSVGDDIVEDVFLKWLEREATTRANGKSWPVAMNIVQAFTSFGNHPKLLSSPLTKRKSLAFHIVE